MASTAIVQAPQEASANSAVSITVWGDVVRSGNFILPAKATLNQALLAAGGLKRDRASTTNRASRKNIVVVLHLNPNGSVTDQLADINPSQKSKGESPLAIRDNDIVVIASYSVIIRNSTRIILDLFSDLQLIGLISN